MNSIIQQQCRGPHQIAGVVRNFRKISTRTGKPMAVFTLGTIPSKCFDVTVDTAAHGAATGEKVLITGHFCNHERQIEFVAQSINLAPAGQTDAQTGFSQGGYPEMSAQEQAPIRESSTVTENLSGSVSNMKIVATHSGRAMVTFKIGNSSCKAFGELVNAVHEAEGKQIEISARKGRFRGVTEYAVEIVKTISGTALNLSDNSDHVSVTASPTSRVESTQHQMPEFVDLKEDERKQIAGGIGEPRGGLSETDDAEDIPDFEPFDPAAYGIKPETRQSSRFLSEPAKPAASATEAEPATETIIALKIVPAEEAVTDKAPEVQGVISKIKDLPTRDGRKMVIFNIGPHNCHLLDKAAEFVATHAPEFEGKLIKLYGVWKINERGRTAFSPEERTVATDPTNGMEADEVQKALEEALFEGSGLRSVGGPTFDEIEAEYKERGQLKKPEPQPESSAVALSNTLGFIECTSP